MPGYWIVKAGPIKDQAALKAYNEVWVRVAPRFGAKVLAGRDQVETIKGTDYPRQLIVRFDSFEAAKACYNDAEYQASLPYAARAFDRELSILVGSS
jgi:uncharacterized protein (DUF1330 family)